MWSLPRSRQAVASGTGPLTLGVEDFEEIVVSSPGAGSPIRVRDIGTVALGPDLRRGVRLAYP